MAAVRAEVLCRALLPSAPHVACNCPQCWNHHTNAEQLITQAIEDAASSLAGDVDALQEAVLADVPEECRTLVARALSRFLTETPPDDLLAAELRDVLGDEMAPLALRKLLRERAS